MSLSSIEKHKVDFVTFHIDQISIRLEQIDVKLNKIYAEKLLQSASTSRDTQTDGADKNVVCGAEGGTVDISKAQNMKDVEAKVTILENVSAVMNKEFKKCLTEMKSIITETSELKTQISKLEAEKLNLERQLQLKDITMAEQDYRIQASAE